MLGGGGKKKFVGATRACRNISFHFAPPPWRNLVERPWSLSFVFACVREGRGEELEHLMILYGVPAKDPVGREFVIDAILLSRPFKDSKKNKV